MNDELDQLFAAYARADAPGCVVAAARRGSPVYRAAFGMANIEHGVANTPATRMPIASVSKHVTCAALLRLAAARKLSLDDPIGQWLPELPSRQRRPTLRQLMTHTGGIRCYLDHAMFDGYATMPVGMPERIQRRQSDVNFEPGSASSYCNGGYLLLSLAMERAAGAPREQVLIEGVLADAGLGSTCLPNRATPVPAGVATSYQPCNEARAEVQWQESRPLTEELFGDGGLISTVDDLLRWAAYLRQTHGPASLGALSATLDQAGGVKSEYGFGLITEEWRGLRIIHHAGGLPGSSAQLLMIPEEEVDIVVLCNRPGNAVDLSFRLAEKLLGDRLGREPASPTAAEFVPLIGTYLAAGTGMMLAFAEQDGLLGVRVFGGSWIPLQPRPRVMGCLPFAADIGTGEMMFRVSSPHGSAVNEIEYFDRAAWHVAERICAPDESAASILAVAPGEYVSEAAASRLHFEQYDNRVICVFRGEYGEGHYPAAMVGHDMVRFWHPGFLSGALARLERDRNGAARIIVSTSRTRRTVFEPASGKPTLVNDRGRDVRATGVES